MMSLVDNIFFPNVKKSLFQMMSLSYDEMLDLTEEKLEKMGVTKVRY